MADNDGKILKALESLQTGQTRLEKSVSTLQIDVTELKQGQAQTNTTVAQIKTAVEALTAGQTELQETVATKADVLTLGVKVDKLRKRIEGIEEHTGSSTHKN